MSRPKDASLKVADITLNFFGVQATPEQREALADHIVQSAVEWAIVEFDIPVADG